MLKKFLFFSVLTFLPFIGLAQVTDPAPYCGATYHNDPAPVDVFINNVTLGEINNQSATGDYIFYDNLTTDISIGVEQSISINVTGYTAHGIGVWIDYNQNNVFENDELVVNLVDLGNLAGLQTETFTVPDDALVGNTRMRVRLIEDVEYFITNNETDMLPCTTPYPHTLADLTVTNEFAFGETEDYVVNILAACVADEDNVIEFEYNNKNYEIIKENKDWVTAANCAVSRGGILVEINDQAEQDEIFLQLGNAGIINANTVAPDGGGGAYVWIGGNDAQNEGVWVWDGGNENVGPQFWQGDATGNPVGGLYNNWGNEPDDFGTQDYLGLSLDGWPLGVAGEWNDITLLNELYFVVEYPENEPEGEVEVTSENDVFSLDVDEQTLQMFAETSPTDEDVVWSLEFITGNATISLDGLLTPLENGIVRVIATSIIDGIEFTGSKYIFISNQAGLITLTATGDTSLALCTGGNTGELSAFVNFKAGVTGTVTFDLIGMPAGATAVIDPLELTGDGLVNITFTNTSAPFVTSNLQLTTTLDVPADVQSLNLDLHTYNGVPFFMTAISPEDNEINVSQQPALDWTDALRAHQYEVQIATDANFTNIILTDDEIFGSEYNPIFNFQIGGDYFWKVRAINPCGTGVWTPVRKFTIQPESGVLGCTDEDALNYNVNADFEDGSCEYPVEGCTDATALNYNDEAVVDDGSCILNIAALVVTEINDSTYHFQVNSNIEVNLVTWEFSEGDPASYGEQIINSYSENGVYPVEALVYSSFTGLTYALYDTITIEAWGCTNPFAVNFDIPAAYDDGSCVPKIFGCTNPLSTNYDPNANTDDGSCSVVILGCTDVTAFNYNPNATNDDGSCEDVVMGCTDETALNYNADANTDDGSCIADISGCTDPDAFNYNPNATNDDGSCIDVIEGCIDEDALNYNANANTDNGTCLYDVPNDNDWQVTITSENHSILIQNSIDLTGVTPAISNGDYIGVFYTNNNGDLQCAGRVEWTGSNLALTAYGNENGQDNGFEDNETFIWKIWRNNSNNDVEVSATYDATQPNQGQYADDGISAITSLSLGITQAIELEEGWNFISTNLSPVNPLMDSVFSTVNADLFLAKDENGDVYWPNVNVNNIGNHIIGEAYKVNMNDDVTIEIKGTTISPENYDITLNQGWSYIGYLRDADANISSVMNAVVSKVFLMKNLDGDVYWPQFNINNIGNMEIGAGYQINMISDTTFNFPANSVNLPALKMAEPELPIFYSEVKTSTRHMHLAIPVQAWNNAPALGSEIAVYAEDVLIGATVWTGDHTVLTIFGHEQSLWDNKPLVFKTYIDGKEVDLDIVLTNNKALSFVENDVLIASELTRKANTDFTYQVVDRALVLVNTNNLSIESKSLQLEIVDYLGRTVYTELVDIDANDKIQLPELVKGQYIVNLKENGIEIAPIKWMNF